MRQKINTYIAVLCITIAGSGAALIIVDIATTDTVNGVFRNNAINQITFEDGESK